MKSGNITVEMLLYLKIKWDTQLIQMMSTLSIDQHKFANDMRFANKRVRMFEIFLILLQGFITSLSIGMYSV